MKVSTFFPLWVLISALAACDSASPVAGCNPKSDVAKTEAEDKALTYARSENAEVCKETHARCQFLLSSSAAGLIVTANFIWFKAHENTCEQAGDGQEVYYFDSAGKFLRRENDNDA